MSSNQHLEIIPSNITSDGTLSFKNGQPVVQFIIGEQERYLIGLYFGFKGFETGFSSPFLDWLISDPLILSSMRFIFPNKLADILLF